MAHVIERVVLVQLVIQAHQGGLIPSRSAVHRDCTGRLVGLAGGVEQVVPARLLTASSHGHMKKFQVTSLLSCVFPSLLMVTKRAHRTNTLIYQSLDAKVLYVWPICPR